MKQHQLPPFRLERWFAEFEFVPGMKNLAASRLAQEQRILLLPGEVYGSAYQQCVRIGYGCDPALFQEGLMAFLEAI